MSEEIKKALTVKTGQRTSYDIYLEENFDGLTEAVKTLEPEKRKICIVTDSTVASLYLNPVKASNNNAGYVHNDNACEL